MHLRNGKWTARIGRNGKKYNLGTFQREIDAARTYAFAVWKSSPNNKPSTEPKSQSSLCPNLDSVYAHKDSPSTQIQPRKHGIPDSTVGVSWVDDIKKWRCRIQHGRRRIDVGYFANKQDAVRAYNQAVLKYKSGTKIIVLPELSSGRTAETQPPDNQERQNRIASTSVNGRNIPTVTRKRPVTASDEAKTTKRRKHALVGSDRNCAEADTGDLPRQGEASLIETTSPIGSSVNASNKDVKGPKVTCLEDYTAEEVACLVHAKGEKFHEVAQSLQEADFQGAFIAEFLSQGEEAFLRFLERDARIAQVLFRISIMKSFQQVPMKGSRL